MLAHIIHKACKSASIKHARVQAWITSFGLNGLAVRGKQSVMKEEGIRTEVPLFDMSQQFCAPMYPSAAADETPQPGQMISGYHNILIRGVINRSPCMSFTWIYRDIFVAVETFGITSSTSPNPTVVQCRTAPEWAFVLQYRFSTIA